LTPLCGCAPRGHPGAQAKGAAREAVHGGVGLLPHFSAVWELCALHEAPPGLPLPRPAARPARLSAFGGARAQDVLTLRDLYEVNLGLARPDSPIAFYDVEKGIVSAAPVRPPSIVHNCDIEHSLVGEGSLLNVRRAALSPRCPPPAL
jgi:hypothetical protein